MDYIGIFDVIGPNMIGPSSSHTAGAVSMAQLARKMFGREIARVTFVLYGSFAKTYCGHGTDKALLGGILGFATDDERICKSFQIAKELELQFEIIADEKTQTDHPNTADIILESTEGFIQSVRGESIGGGKVKIVRINQIDVEFTGEYSTLIVKHTDTPGVVAHITQCLSNQDVNIAFMRLFREDKGAIAYTIVESDEDIPESVPDRIKSNRYVQELMLIQL